MQSHDSNLIKLTYDIQHIKNGNTALEKVNTAGQKGTSAGTRATRRAKRARLRIAVLKMPRMNTV